MVLYNAGSKGFMVGKWWECSFLMPEMQEQVPTPAGARLVPEARCCSRRGP